MKILITTDWYKPVINGVVTSVCSLSEGLEALGHEVRILTLSENRTSYTEGNATYLGSHNADFVYPSARVHFVGGNRELEKLLQWHPDIVHSNCEFSTFRIARKIAHALDIPLVHTYHTVYEDYTDYVIPVKRLGKAMAYGISKHTLKKTERVIVPSEKIQTLLRGYRVRTPISVVPTGIHMLGDSTPQKRQTIRDSLGLQSGETLFLSLGRLAREKNCEELLQLFARLPHRDWHLLFVGDGPDRLRLVELAEQLGLNELVTFTGMVSPEAVTDYYHAADVFVSASTSETQGLTYYEALSCGLPLLCREDEALKDILQNGNNGFAYTCGTEFQQAVAVLQSESDRMRMGLASSAIAEDFGYLSFSQKMAEIYETEIARRHHSFSA